MRFADLRKRNPFDRILTVVSTRFGFDSLSRAYRLSDIEPRLDKRGLMFD